MTDPFVIEHDYDREAKEVSAWYWIDGYITGKNRSSGIGYTLKNMKAGDGTYYVATNYMKGYRKGLSEPYVGKLTATYSQKKNWQIKILSQGDLI